MFWKPLFRVGVPFGHSPHRSSRHYNTTLTFDWASDKCYAIKIIRYYAFLRIFRKNVFFLPVWNVLSEKKGCCRYTANAYHLCHHFFLLISSSFSIFMMLFCCYYYYYCDPSMNWRNIKVRIKSNPWDVLLLCCYCAVAIAATCIAYFVYFISFLFSCFDDLVARVWHLLRSTFWNDKAFVNY